MNGRPFQLTSVSREFGPVDVLRNITLDIEHGEFVALVGPSGCGKTTLLNILSGDDRPSSGVIQHAGRMRMVYQQDEMCIRDRDYLVAAEHRLGFPHRQRQGL